MMYENGLQKWRIEAILHHLFKARENERWDDLINTTALLIFGIVLCPEDGIHIGAPAINLLTDICQKGAEPAPVLLADTIVCLNQCRKGYTPIFQGPTPMLFIWACAHLPSACPRRSPFDALHQFTSNHYDWESTWDEMNETQLQWTSPFLNTKQLLIQVGQAKCIPLIGTRGYVTYSPLAVLRQYGMTQIVPAIAALKGSETNIGDAEYHSLVAQAVRTWRAGLTYLAIPTQESRNSLPGYAEWLVQKCVSRRKDKRPMEDEVSHGTSPTSKRNWPDRIRDYDEESGQMRDTIRQYESEMTELKQAMQVLNDQIENLRQENMLVRQARAQVTTRNEALTQQVSILSRESAERAAILREKHRLLTLLRDDRQYMIRELRDNDRVVTIVKKLVNPVRKGLRGIGKAIQDVAEQVPKPFGVEELKNSYKKLTKDVLEVQKEQFLEEWEQKDAEKGWERDILHESELD